MQIRGQIETNGQFLPGIVKKTSDAGFYLSSRPNMRNNLTELAQRNRHEMGRIATRWKHELTAAQQIAWNSFAAANPITTPAGNTKTLNGQQYFQMVNHRKWSAGLEQKNDPPSNANPGQTTAPTVRMLDQGLLGITFRNQDPWTKRSTARAVVIDNGPQNQTAGYQSKWGRVAGVFPGIPQLGYPIEIVSPRPYTTAQQTAASIKFYVADDERRPGDEKITTTADAPGPPPPPPCDACPHCVGSAPFPPDPLACNTPRFWSGIAIGSVVGTTSVTKNAGPCDYLELTGPPNIRALQRPAAPFAVQLFRQTSQWGLRLTMDGIPPQFSLTFTAASPGDCTSHKLFTVADLTVFGGSVWIFTPEPYNIP